MTETASVGGQPLEPIWRWRCPVCPGVTYLGDDSDVTSKASMHWAERHGPLPGQAEIFEVT